MEPGTFGGTFDDWQASLHPADRAECVDRVAAAMADPGPYVILHRSIWPDGSVHWLEGRGQVMTDDDGRGRHMGVVLDVTEREERRRRSHARSPRTTG